MDLTPKVTHSLIVTLPRSSLLYINETLPLHATYHSDCTTYILSHIFTALVNAGPFLTSADPVE
jgi:hypothetical protein